MGKIVVPIRVENFADTEAVAYGYRTEPPRRVEAEALVDTGAGGLYLQASVVRQLGLRPLDTIQARTMSNRAETRQRFSIVELEVQGRTAHFRVIEIPDSLPNLIGRIPLQEMDWVLDMKNERLVGNPEHGGEWIDDELGEEPIP